MNIICEKNESHDRLGVDKVTIVIVLYRLEIRLPFLILKVLSPFLVSSTCTKNKSHCI